MKRSTLITTIAVALKNKGEKENRLPTAIEEWLDGNKWAGAVFDKNGWNLKRFVSDVKNESNALSAGQQ